MSKDFVSRAWRKVKMDWQTWRTRSLEDEDIVRVILNVHKRRKAFLRKWHLKCHTVANSLEEAGDKLFTFTRLSQSQWKSARTTNAIERLNEEFRRRIKTQTVLPVPRDCADVVLGLGWPPSRFRFAKSMVGKPTSQRTLDLAA